eukprot:CAMPEP_0197879380 /NCGR_PEP_ID=MMETSP1439-20131203/7496_1 /TAXON_ID=66791 /ORGANISM="Gonyaulax spinifera, Strain CCMP409" /LENGTH=126 /DNA_ID=CAMNT_0043498881 /DNA_START=68 /DNA_END=445 /DNA_ORIENTATION=+
MSAARGKEDGGSPREAVLAVRCQLGALVHVAGDLGVGDGEGRGSGLCQATTLLLQGQRSGLGEARVRDLVVEHVHDLAKVLGLHVLAADGLHDPAALHAGEEGLALRVPGVARGRDDLHGHCALAA